MKEFIEKQDTHINPFIENINAVNRLYNQPIELIFDYENIYIGTGEEYKIPERVEEVDR